MCVCVCVYLICLIYIFHSLWGVRAECGAKAKDARRRQRVLLVEECMQERDRNASQDVGLAPTIVCSHRPLEVLLPAPSPTPNNRGGSSPPTCTPLAARAWSPCCRGAG